jgi:hypothetical protein
MPQHVVCGFICENKKYIFDSNYQNDFFNDDWTSLNFHNYVDNTGQIYIDEMEKNITKMKKGEKDTELAKIVLQKIKNRFSHDPNTLPQIKYLIYCKSINVINTRKRKISHHLNKKSKISHHLTKKSKISHNLTKKIKISHHLTKKSKYNDGKKISNQFFYI